ncbi:MAG: radical SAM protein [Marinobacterium sp.]|nr:radical SAM protein [Marinobacterium sp.]
MDSFSLDSKIEIEDNIIIKKFKNSFIIVVKNTPKKIVFTPDEYLIYNELRKGLTLREAMVHLYRTNQGQLHEDHCVKLTENFLEKIVDNYFLKSQKPHQEERIEKILKKIHINITSDCNIRCKHCYMSAGVVEKKFLDIAKIISFVESINISRVEREIVISGGEPLLVNDLPLLINKLGRLGFSTALFTNGTLMTEGFISSCYKNISSVQVSLEAATEYSFDSIRGKGSFKKLISGIEIIKSFNLHLILAFTLCKTTFNDLAENILHLLNSIDYENISIRINSELDKEGNATKNPDIFFTDSIKAHESGAMIINMILEKGFQIQKNTEQNTLFNNCGIGASINIYPDGSVHPCSEAISELSLDITHSPESILNKFDEINTETSIHRIEKCSKCEIRYICGAGCRVKNMKENGSFIIPQCNEHKVFENIYRDALL